MKFSKTKHGNELLEELLIHATPIPISLLEEKLKLSRRSIFYAINQLNKELDAVNLNEIQDIRDNGYVLTEDTKNYFLTNHSPQKKHLKFYDIVYTNVTFSNLNKKNRLHLMEYCLICRSTTSLTDLMNIFNVSKNTILKDINIIKQTLSPALKLKNGSKGKYIEGKEKNKRRWIFSHLNSILYLYPMDDSHLIQSKYFIQLSLLEKITGNYFTDDSKKILSYFIQWSVERIKYSSSFLLTEKSSIDKNSLTYIWAKSLLSDENITSSKEAEFLSELVTTQSFQSVNKKSPMLKKLLPITTQIIQNFNNITGISLPKYTGDTKNSLSKSLTVHLISTYYRVYYKVPYHNPLLKQIKDSYKETFEITKVVLKPFNEYCNAQLSEDEIALITVYFSGALRSTQLNQKNLSYGVPVVCSSGIGTSRLLLSQLKQRYPKINFLGPFNLLEFENLNKSNIRLVLTTTQLSHLKIKIPILQMSPLPTEIDWKNLNHYLTKTKLIDTNHKKINTITLMDIISNYARIVEPKNLEKALDSYINQPTSYNKKVKEKCAYYFNYRVIDKETCWHDAIKISLTDMLKNKIITKNYINKIINLTQTRGNYMALGNGIFLAHATPTAGVNKLGISFTYFKHPFFVLNDTKKPINLIVGLAPIDQEKHLHLLSSLLQCIQNPIWLKKLNQIQTNQQLKKLLIDGHLI